MCEKATPEVRDSTGLSEHPVRTMSLVLGAVEQKPQNRDTSDGTCLQWHEVPLKQFTELIIEAILEGTLEKIPDSAMMAKLANRAIVELPVLALDHNPDFTECMSSTEKESVVHGGWDISELDEKPSENEISTES